MKIDPDYSLSKQKKRLEKKSTNRYHKQNPNLQKTKKYISKKHKIQNQRSNYQQNVQSQDYLELQTDKNTEKFQCIINKEKQSPKKNSLFLPIQFDYIISDKNYFRDDSLKNHDISLNIEDLQISNSSSSYCYDEKQEINKCQKDQEICPKQDFKQFQMKKYCFQKDKYQIQDLQKFQSEKKNNHLRNESRGQKLIRYLKKKSKRIWKKKIQYDCRKTFADQRKRIGGRFSRIKKSPNISQNKISQNS